MSLCLSFPFSGPHSCICSICGLIYLCLFSARLFICGLLSLSLSILSSRLTLLVNMQEWTFPTSRFSDTHRVNIEMLPDTNSPGTLQGELINWSSFKIVVILLSDITYTRVGFVVPAQNTYWHPPKICLGLCMDLYIFKHMCIHTRIIK